MMTRGATRDTLVRPRPAARDIRCRQVRLLYITREVSRYRRDPIMALHRQPMVDILCLLLLYPTLPTRTEYSPRMNLARLTRTIRQTIMLAEVPRRTAVCHPAWRHRLHKHFSGDNPLKRLPRFPNREIMGVERYRRSAPRHKDTDPFQLMAVSVQR